MSFFVAFADLGIQFSLLREIGSRKSEKARRFLLSRGLAINSLTVFVFYWVALLAFIPIGRAYGIGNPFFLVSLSAAFSIKQIAALLFSYSAGKRMFKQLSEAIVLSAIAYSVLAIFLTMLFGIRGLFWAILAGSIIDAFLKAGMVNLRTADVWALGKSFFRFGSPEDRLLVSGGLVFMASTWFATALQNYDDLILGAFHEKGLVSYYAVAYLPIFPMLVAANSIFAAPLPGISSLSGPEKRRVFGKSVKYACLVSSALAIAGIPAYFFLTEFFLEKYALSATLLTFLAVPFIIESGVNNTTVNFLIAFGMNRVSFAMRGIQLTISVIFGFFLIREFWIWGAVASVWMSSLSGLALSAFFYFKGEFFK